jgi:hypothetical protein
MKNEGLTPGAISSTNGWIDLKQLELNVFKKIRWHSISVLLSDRIVLQTLTFTLGEKEISPVSENAIFLF